MQYSYFLKTFIGLIGFMVFSCGFALASGYTLAAPQDNYTPPIIFSGPAALMAQGLTPGYDQQYNPNQEQKAVMPGQPFGQYGATQRPDAPTGASPVNSGLRPTASDRFKAPKKSTTMKTRPVIRDNGVSTPNELYGTATALSGNTLRLQGRRIVLSSVSSPSSHQVCSLQGGIPWNCGRQAKNSLETILRSGPTRCEVFPDNHGYCTILGQPINSAMSSR